jgi:hypothetical protein
MARFVAVVGARSLPASWGSRVVSVVRWLVSRGFGIGGASELPAWRRDRRAAWPPHIAGDGERRCMRTGR